MRALVPLVILSLLAVSMPALAEWGAYGPDGWPLDVDGRSTRPAGMPAIDDDHGHTILDPVDDEGPVNEVAGTTVYPYWPVLTAELQRLASEHPDIVRLHSAGKSTAGLDLWMIELADFARLDAGEGVPLEEREVAWVDGGTHSNEYSGVYFVAHLAAFLADGYGTNETATWIVDNRHTWLMPLVNPDGSHLFGRLNANAVNINRNYPVDWGGIAENPLFNNPGPEPASEVETRINIEWFEKVHPDYYASVHCCGNLWLYPYGVEGLDPADQDMLSRVCDEAFPTVREDCGPIWSTIYPASGSSVDTAYEYTGAVAFGYEMSGRGALVFWGQPFTTESVREQEMESWEGVLHAFRHVHLYGAHPVVASVEAVHGGVAVTLLNDGYGNLTKGTLRIVDGDGEDHVVELPHITAGTQATVVVPGPFTEGPAEVVVEYVKRVQSEPEGLVRATLVFADGGAVETEPGVHVVDLQRTIAEESAALSPFVAGVLVVALALGLFSRRRL
ncbi:MAG: hypothetical protein KY455_01110 [Euryarchaeota archaeon]|nr:hypothetical protein [Euryarchaeota archaeon]